VNTKLVWVNLLLIALVAAIAWRVRAEWMTQQAREQAIRTARVVPRNVTPAPIPAPPSPVTAGTYSDIASRMLFSKERNPTVIIDMPPPPPPKPMPPLPLLHGVLGLPSGMVALMSPDAKSPGKPIKVGEKIGEFELAGLTQDEISLKWEDKTVTRSVSEMIYQGLEKAPAAGAPQQLASAAPPPAATLPPPSGSGKPGGDVGGTSDGFKMCPAGDTSPAGTVADGYRKVLTATPFGNSCHWEPAK
jgi:hypothetical protein